MLSILVERSKNTEILLKELINEQKNQGKEIDEMKDLLSDLKKEFEVKGKLV